MPKKAEILWNFETQLNFSYLVQKCVNHRQTCFITFCPGWLMNHSHPVWGCQASELGGTPYQRMLKPNLKFEPQMVVPFSELKYWSRLDCLGWWQAAVASCRAAVTSCQAAVTSCRAAVNSWRAAVTSCRAAVTSWSKRLPISSIRSSMKFL